MKKIFLQTVLFMLLMFLGFTGYAQKTKQAFLIEEARSFALCHCIRKGYSSADTSLAKKLKDYSEAYYVQVSDLPIDAIEEVSKYVDSNFEKYRAIPQELGPSNPSANMVAYSCLNLYKSKSLRAYIKKLLQPSFKK